MKVFASEFQRAVQGDDLIRSGEQGGFLLPGESQRDVSQAAGTPGYPRGAQLVLLDERV